jgi:hypothetical protein
MKLLIVGVSDSLISSLSQNILNQFGPTADQIATQNLKNHRVVTAIVAMMPDGFLITK